MIKVEIKRNQEGKIISWQTKGHAGYSIHGEDIVCAAVSALVQTAVLGLIHNLQVKPEVEIKDGYLSCFLPSVLAEEKRHSVNLILEVMLTGLRAISEEHHQHLRIID